MENKKKTSFYSQLKPYIKGFRLPFLLSVIAAYHLRLHSTLATLTDAVFTFPLRISLRHSESFYSYSKSSVLLFPPP